MLIFSPLPLRCRFTRRLSYLPGFANSTLPLQLHSLQCILVMLYALFTTLCLARPLSPACMAVAVNDAHVTAPTDNKRISLTPLPALFSNLLPFKRLLAFWHGENVFRVTDRITAFHGEMFSSQLDSRFPFSAILMRTSISLDLSHPFFSHFCTCMDAWTQTQHPDNLCSCFPFAFSSLAVCLFHSLPLIPCNFKFTSLSCISIPFSLSSDSDAFAHCSFHASLHLFSRHLSPWLLRLTDYPFTNHLHY